MQWRRSKEKVKLESHAKAVYDLGAHLRRIESVRSLGWGRNGEDKKKKLEVKERRGKERRRV